MKNFILFFTLVIILLSCAGNDSLPGSDDIDIKKLFPTTVTVPSSKTFLYIDDNAFLKGYIGLFSFTNAENITYGVRIEYGDENKTSVTVLQFYGDDYGDIAFEQVDSGASFGGFSAKEYLIGKSDINMNLIVENVKSVSSSTDTCLYGYTKIKDETEDITSEKSAYYKYSGNNVFTRIGIFEMVVDNGGTENISLSEGVDCDGKVITS